MEGLVKGDVVVLGFPFSNLIETKKRPALILKVPKGDDLIVCQITGNSNEESVEVKIIKGDFMKGKLRLKSYVRMDKIFSVEKFLIKYKIGSLRKEKFDEILEEVCSYLKS
jgi:mRNA interferase MazF